MTIVRKGLVRGLYLSILVLGIPGALVVGRLIGHVVYGPPSIWLY